MRRRAIIVSVVDAMSIRFLAVAAALTSCSGGVPRASSTTVAVLYTAPAVVTYAAAGGCKICQLIPADCRRSQ